MNGENSWCFYLRTNPESCSFKDIIYYFVKQQLGGKS